MQLDFIIKGGHVIDPENNVDYKKDIGVLNGKIVGVDENDTAKNIINAEEYFVCPGFIDFHTHIFHTGSGLGINPDLFFSDGVTTVVDAGTAGCSTYDAFHNTVIVNSWMNIKSQLNISSQGQIQLGFAENYDKKLMDKERIKYLFEKYQGELIGLKIRLQSEVVGELGIKPLFDTIEIAEYIGCPVVIHTTNPPESASEIVKVLRKGDVYCHCYQGKGHTIINSNGKVFEEIKKARERGVIFDISNGTGNFGFKVAKEALEDGFYPDIISCDSARYLSYSLDYYAKNLPFVMSKFLALGMSLNDIIKATTSTPAKCIGEDIRGSLKENNLADIVIFKLLDKNIEYRDPLGENLFGNKIIVPKLTMSNGEVVYCTNDF
ncbi:metallo-dependent hydrolase [Clostridium sediminicola]|uniref:metallo-dependent hydrolase n=1 Tax=Clostridium sediminicola TaxID=3114879 RepID=UPI0031F1D9FE